MQAKKGRSVQQWALVAVLGIAVLGSTLAIARRDTNYAFLDPLIEIAHIIRTQYVDQPDEKALQLGAINGMIEALDDPHTVYVPPAERRDFDKDLTGQYVGIGALVTMQDGWLTIVSPLEDSPAFRAGIMADDRVVEIEGESTFDLTIDECVDRLMGTPDTEVNIVVERSGERLPFTIVRQKIVTRTVKGLTRSENGDGEWGHFVDPDRKIAYIRLTQFTPTAGQELRDTLVSLGADSGELGGLILDLRFNRGGVLQQAIEMSDLFLAGGVIVSTKGRAHPEEIARAHAEGTLGEFPMVVLVNQHSASASEILAGTLKENDRAIVLGSRTFGKGVVQTVHPLRTTPDAELKITEQQYYLPSGRCIQRTHDSTEWGVDPSEGYYVPMTDEQIMDLLTTWRDEDVIRAEGEGEGGQIDWSDPKWIAEQRSDVQLAAALESMQARIDTGQWKPTGKEGIAGAQIVLQELNRAEDVRERMLRELARLDGRIEELRVSAAEPEEPAEHDLWPDDVDLTDGRLELFDADGNRITTLRITGNSLERWLMDADVERIEAAPGADDSQ